MRLTEEHILVMKRMAKRLLPFTYPKVDFEEEQVIIPLKQSQVNIDGYEVMACFSNAEYSRYILESIQIQSVYTPFLPFNVVCKIGGLFLGLENLSYVEFFRANKKVYCWTLKRLEDGSTQAPHKRLKRENYQGFNYSILNPGSVDLH